MTCNPLTHYAEWLSSATDDWPALAIERAASALIDTLAVSIAGASESPVKIALNLAQQWGRGSCQVIGHPQHLSAPMAALVNGTAAHALDFDDNFDPAKAHASAVLVPALLALADERDFSTDKVLDAYIVGLQIMGKTGQAVNPYHRSRGWHATATLGTIGAAAGCARLLGLGAEQAAHAVSLSTSFSGGMMSQFGTMTKPLHAGMAASGGVQAACFAEQGFTAGDQTLHGKKGLRQLMVGPDIELLAEHMQGKAEHGQTMLFDVNNIGEPLHILEYGLKVKRHPNCGSVHRALDGLLALCEQHQIPATDVDHVLVRAPSAHLANLMYPEPDDAMQARFSLEYNLAVGLQNGEVTLADFSDKAITDPTTRNLLKTIRREPVDKMESEFPTEVHIQRSNGDVVSTSVKMPVGSLANPLSSDQSWQKYQGCVEPILGENRSVELRQALEQLNSRQSVRQLLALTV